MSLKIKLDDLPTNLIAFIYQYLDVKDMINSGKACRKLLSALEKDYMYIELAKRQQLFCPSESEKFETWKDYFMYLKQLSMNIHSGRANIGFKMVPYRGHNSPIEAIGVFNNRRDISKTIVSGDSNGEVLTWNIEEDEDGDKEYVKDPIIKGDSNIAGIKSLNDDSNMIIWTKKNKFYYFEVNMYKDIERNASRFSLLKEFIIDEGDNTIKHLYYEEKSNTLYMSADLGDDYRLKNIYSYNLKSFILDKYTFDYNSQQTHTVLNENNPMPNNNQGWNAFNNNNMNIFPVIHPMPIFNNPPFNDNPIFSNIKESRKKNINYFVVTEDKIITYINKEPVRKRLISQYNNKNLLPNVFVFKKSTRLHESYHIDLDYILNILPINDEEVAFIGNYYHPGLRKYQLIMKIYKTNFFTLSREKVLYDGKPENFDIVFYNKVELYYLINDVNLNKLENIQIMQLKINFIGTLKHIPSINCVEGDMFRIVIASDDLFMTIFDIKTGRQWFNFLGGSKTVQPKSFKKHPYYEGFHLIKVTRNSIVSAIGNLIREYRFTFNHGDNK